MDISTEKLLGLAQTKSNKLQKYETVATNPERVNTKSPADLQFDLGYALGEQVFTRDDGSKYQFATNPDGTFAHDAQGKWIPKDFDTSGFADNQRNLYIDNTRSGDYKLGLAASGTKDGITPFEARYRDNTTLGNPYKNDRPSLYDGTPGTKGVTPEDGALLDVTLPFKTATDLEYNVHSNVGQLANRAIGQGKFSKDEGKEFGSGKTEYTTPNAPLWNIDAQNPEVSSLEDGTLLPKQPFSSTKMTTQNEGFIPAVTGQKTFAENLVDAGQAGLGTFAAKTADTAVDALLRAGKVATSEEAVNKVTRDFSVINNEGDFVGLDKFKLQTEYGYNPKNVETASDSIRKAYQEPSVGNVFGAILDSVKAGPEVLLTSAGDVLAAVAGPVGWAVHAGNFTNEILEERAEAKGGIGNLTATDRVIAAAGGVPAALLNSLSRGNVGLLELKNGVQTAVSEGAVSAVKSGIGRGLRSAIGEGLEEAAQEGITTIASKIQTANQKELMTDKFWEDLAVSGGLGFGAGAAGSAIGGTRDALTSDTVKQAAEAVKETVTTKEDKQATDRINKTQQDNQTKAANSLLELNKAVTSGDIDSIEKHYIDAQTFAAESGDQQLIDSVEAQFVESVNTLSKLAEEAMSQSSDNVKTLGADKTDLEKENLVRSLINAIDATDINTTQLRNIADNLGLNVEKVKEQADRAIKVNKIAKLASEVEGEVTTGSRGFKTYISEFEKAGKNNDSVAQQRAADRITTFMGKQEEKSARYKSAVAQATKEINAQVSGLKGAERIRALGAIKGSTKVDGHNFDINHKNVAESMLDGTRKGGLAVIDRIDTSVNAMNDFLKENKLDIETGEVTVDPTKDTAKKKQVTQKTFDFFRNKLDETVGKGFTVERALSDLENTADNLKGFDVEDKEFIKADLREYVASKPKAPEAEKVTEAEPKVEDVTEDTAPTTEEKPVKETKPKVALNESISTTIAGNKIVFTTVEKSKDRPLAVTNSKGEIQIQQGLTVNDIIKYLTEDEVVGDGVKDIVAVKRQVNDHFQNKYGIDFLDILADMTDANVRKFLLLHENQHLNQIEDANGFSNFMKLYKKDPVKYELDANIKGLEALGLLPKEVKVPVEKNVAVALTDLEDTLKENKGNKEAIEFTVNSARDSIKSASESIGKYFDELTRLKTEKKGLKARLTKELFELKNNRDKLKKAQKHLEDKKILLDNPRLKTVVSRLKGIMVKIVGQVARLKSFIKSNNDNIDGIRSRLGDVTKEIESIYDKVEQAKTDVKSEKETIEVAKEVVKDVKKDIAEVKEQIAGDVLNTTEQAKELFTPTKNAGLDLTDVKGEDRVTIKKIAKRISKVIDEQLKTIPMDTLNKDTEIFSRVFVEEVVENVKTRTGNKNVTTLRLSDRVAEMMAVESLAYGTEKLNDLAYNDDIQIKKMLGFSDQTVLPKEVRDAMTGIGRYHSLEAAGLGKRVLKDVGVKAKDTSKNQTQAKMESTLGGMLFKAMEDIGMVEYVSDDSFTTDTYAELKDMVEARNEENASSISMELDTVKVVQGSGVPIPMIKSTKKAAIEFRDRFQESSDRISEDLGTDKWVKTARTKKKDSSVHEVRGMEKEVTIPKKQDKVLNDMENKEWVMFSENVAELKKEWDKYAHKIDAPDDVIEASDKENKLLKVFGWKDPESVHTDSRDGVMAKNRVIKDSFERLFGFNEKMKDRDFYFNWFFSKSGRFFMDSTEVNPQTDKLHRFVMGHKDAVGTVDSVDTRNEFKLAVVQAFDGSKLLGNQSEDRGDLIVNGEVISDLGSIDKQSMGESLKQFEAIMQAIDRHEGDVLDLVAGTDHPAHALMAVKELKNYSDSTPFETRMTLETDAVTSGFILGLLANPTMPFKKLKKWLAKGGVWLGGTSAESFGEYNGTRDANGNKVNLDSYETGAEAVQELVNPQLNNPTNIAIDKLVGGVSRKFMKAPFMTFIYGSSIDNIKASIGRDVADLTMQKLSDKDTVLETVSVLRDLGLTSAINKVTHSRGSELAVEAIASRFRDLSVDDKVKARRDLARTIHNTVNQSVQRLHGEAVKKYMNNEFKEIVGDKKAKKKGSKSLVNSGFVELFDKFKTEFDKRISPDMTTKEKDDALEAMAEEGLIPGIFTVNSDRKDFKQRTGIVKKQPISQKESVQIPFKKSRTLHPVLREMVEAPSSGAVLNIHWLDGSIISEVLGLGDALGIHDATLQVVGMATKNSKAYSQNTWDMTQGYSVIEELASELDRQDINSDTTKGIKELAVTIQDTKKLMSGIRVDIEHMSMPGSKVTVDGEAIPDTVVVDTIEDIKEGNPIDITDLSSEDIKGVVSEMTASDTKVSPKANDAKIQDKIVGIDIDILDAIPDEHC